jgi:integrase
MRIYRRGPKPEDPKQDKRIWWYAFEFAGRRIQESAKTASKTLAREAMKKRRRELEEGFSGVEDKRRERIRTVADIAEEYRDHYMAVPGRTSQFVPQSIRHVIRLCGSLMTVDCDESVIKKYQTARLKEKASPTTINHEVGVFMRILGEHGDLLRLRLKRRRALNLPSKSEPGRAFTPEEQRAMLAVARESTEAARRAIEIRQSGKGLKGEPKQGGSVAVYPALMLALGCGLRAKEMRGLRWAQVDLVRGVLTVGQSKSEAGTGRTIPLNPDVLTAMREHAAWYARRFGNTAAAWCVFPGGSRWPSDPTKPVTTLSTAWDAVRERAGVSGRWHDNRHTFVTELCESGEAGDETIRALAGHVSAQMMKHYSHIGLEAKRRAVDALAKKKLADVAAGRPEAAAEPDTGEGASGEVTTFSATFERPN